MEELTGAKYANVRTFRANGEPVGTPVWPAVVDEKLYFGTPAHTHKVGRIQRNPSVEVAACDSRGNPTGPWRRGTARRLSAAEFRSPEQAIARQHLIATPLIRLFARIRRWEYIGIEVQLLDAPASDTTR